MSTKVFHIEGTARSALPHFFRDRLFLITIVAAELTLAAMIFQLMRIFGPGFGASLLVFLVLAVIIVVRPALGLGMIIALSLFGDAKAMPWWPAVKNFSSRESELFINNQLTVNPFEILLALVVAVWLVGRARSWDKTPMEFGPFWRPLLLFSVSLLFGLTWGLARGGDLRVAIFEIRPLLYVPILYLVTTNLFTTLRHYVALLSGIIFVLALESTRGVWKLASLRDVFGDASPVEHTAAVHWNLVLLLLLAVSWFGSRRIGQRSLVFVLAIPTTVLFLAAERRAAVVGLVIGAAFLAAILYRRDRAKFFRVIPIVAIVLAGYAGVFWNNDSQAGFPVQAIKTIVQPDSASDADASSDLYRELENYNLNATIRSSPVFGIGFGQPFLRPIPLPDISTFEFHPYIPHNSLLWIWTQVGLVGFVSFLYLVGHATAVGVRASVRAVNPDHASLVAVMAAYIPLLCVVAYVDISFDIQTTIIFGAALALVGSAERLMGLDPVDSSSASPKRNRDRYRLREAR